MESVIYCRVSSREQEETGYSLPSQEKLLLEYAKRKGFKNVKVFSVAESASGTKARKVFAEMMDYVAKHRIKHLIVEKVDRLTRNLKEAVVANDWIDEDEERRIHFAKNNLIIHKNATSDEKFRWDIEIVLAKKVIANLSEEVKKGQAEKVAQGWLPRQAPVGYKTVGEEGHKIHVIDPVTSPLVRKIFELYASGNYSMNVIREIISQEGLRNSRGNTLVKSKIEIILKDPFYYGAIRWNETFSKGAHEPLITKELFDRAQDVRSGKKAPQFNRHQFQFRKMFTCGECKGTITAEIQKGIVYYHCNHYRNCSQKKYTPEEKLEERLLGVFKFFENITEQEAEEIKTQIKQNHAQEAEYKESIINTLDERYKRLQKRLDTLYNDRLDDLITAEVWKLKQEEIVGEQTQIQEQLKKLKTEEAKYFEIWLNILDLARRAREIYEKRSPEERRLLLSHIFSNLVITDEDISYTLKEPVQRLAERVQQKLDTEKTFEPVKSDVLYEQKDSFEPLCPALLGYKDSNLN